MTKRVLLAVAAFTLLCAAYASAIFEGDVMFIKNVRDVASPEEPIQVTLYIKNFRDEPLAAKVYDTVPEAFVPYSADSTITEKGYAFEVNLGPQEEGFFNYYILFKKISKDRGSLPKTLQPARLVEEGGKTLKTISPLIEYQESYLTGVVDCNIDGVCESWVGETPYTCWLDCKTGQKDKICDRMPDGVCDPDCPKKEDPDCGREATPKEPAAAKEGNQIFALAGFVLLVVLLAAVVMMRLRK